MLGTMEMNSIDDAGYFGLIGKPNVTAVYSPIKQEEHLDENGVSNGDSFNHGNKNVKLESADDSNTERSNNQDVTVLSGAPLTVQQPNVGYISPEKYQSPQQYDLAAATINNQIQFTTTAATSMPQFQQSSQPQTFTLVPQQQFAPSANPQSVQYTNQQLQTVQFIASQQQLPQQQQVCIRIT